MRDFVMGKPALVLPRQCRSHASTGAERASQPGCQQPIRGVQACRWLLQAAESPS